jgi:transcription antitermination factor NusG
VHRAIKQSKFRESRMKREWDLIRRILTAAEEKQAGQVLNAKEIDDIEVAIVGAHIAMLQDAGYVKAKVMKTNSGVYAAAFVQEITLPGYDLLDTIRNDTVWNKIKSISSQKGLELTFEVIKKVGQLALDQVLGP